MISLRLCLLVAIVLVNKAVVDGGIGLSAWEFFIGNGKDVERVIPISFKPEEGIRLREKFEKKYGPKGEKLISSFGDGQHIEQHQTQ